MDQLSKDKNGIYGLATEKQSISYPSRGNEDCYEIEDQSFWFKHRNHIIELMINRFPFQGNFVDIGGGNGFQVHFLTKKFPQKTFILMEPGYSGCLNAKKRGVEHIFNLNFRDFPFSKYQIKAVGLFDVIEHMKNDTHFIKELKNKCLENALFYITVPAHHWLWSSADSDAGHYRRYNEKMLKDLALKSGLKFVWGSYFFSYLLPLTYLFRSLPNKLGKKENSAKRLKNELAQHCPKKPTSSMIEFLSQREISHIEKKARRFGASYCAVLES